ncbi:type VI immunity family protein [Mitsuaria sp. 7]|uniref:type VI immunity family protein n=1 Tax=Mitsuaria sp. 7 TaxID=1658665 RepID=UPI0007DCF599|nr:type VI immunity family protein [Mitsuaria sp. 7]ANH67326.1 hypothetical protein ABE85_06645 [Mitsuaria sp. 7]
MDLGTRDFVAACRATVYVASPDQLGGDAVMAVVERLRAGGAALRVRSASGAAWRSLDQGELTRRLHAWSEHPDRDAVLQFSRDGASARDAWDEVDAAIVRRGAFVTTPRASELSFRFEETAPAAELAAFGLWAMERLPVWWGCAGWQFVRRAGWGFWMEDRALIARARRYWTIQPLDPVLMQWDALDGLPGVNWLTMLGDAFLQQRELDVDGLCAAAAALGPEGVYLRRAGAGVVMAAGPQPLPGDINARAALAPYVRIAELLSPLLLTAHGTRGGEGGGNEVFADHLARFLQPDRWLAAPLPTR